MNTWKKRQRKIKKFATRMKRNPTHGEAVLRDWLRKNDYHFEFQKIVKGFIADFFFVDIGLVIELDGSSHLNEGQKARDQIKDSVYRREGYSVLRINEKEYLNSSSGAFNKMLAEKLVSCKIIKGIDYCI